MHPQHLFRATTLFLFCSAISGGAVFAQYRYNKFGQLVDGRGQLANVHQEMHDMLNSTLYTTGAVAVSNTVDPNFTQATLTQIEAAMAPTPEPGGQAMSRLYLTPTNPYTPGAGVQSGTPTGYNHDHYNQILLDAPVGGYVPTQSGAYIAKTHPDSSSELYNRGFHTYEANPKFLAAKEAAGGQGGGIVFLVNQSAESYSHLRAISGSNVFMTGYVRPPSGGVVVLGGQVVLNPQHNTNQALDTNQYGPAYVAGVSQIQGQTLDTGNEAGFWVTGTGSDTQIANWGDGSAGSIAAAYNPDAQFHVHTHPGDTGPSFTDMLASALLNGMPGVVVSNNGSYAYGFQVERGWLPTPDGVVVFGDRGWASGNPSTVGDSGIGGGSNSQNSGASGWTFGGLLAGKPEVTGNLSAGHSGGVTGSGCISGCTGITGTIHPIAIGATASVDVSVINVSYNWSGNPDAPASIAAGAQAGIYGPIGGSVNIGLNPAGSVSSGVTVGAGVGGILAIGGVQIGSQNSSESTSTGATTNANDSQGSNRSIYGGNDGNTAPDGMVINGLI